MLGLAIFVRLLSATDQRRMFGLSECGPEQRAHHPVRRADPGAADPAGDHHQRAGSDQSRARTRCAKPAMGWAPPSGRRSGTMCCPMRIPGILTGTILAISRAIGETAPLVIVGASTYITFDPDGPSQNSPPCRSRSTNGPLVRRMNFATSLPQPLWC